MTDINQGLWTIEQVAHFFQVRASVVKYWVHSLGLPHVKLGKHYRFDPNDIMSWVRSQKRGLVRSSSEEELRRITLD